MNRVQIERIAAGGDGVGRLPDGRVVFVPRSAPGDAIDIELTEEKARFARGSVLEVVTASPDRAQPECWHYVADRCGGCQLQHLTIDAQLRAKASLVGDALRRIGGRNTPDPPIVPSATLWRYRNRIALAVARHSAPDSTRVIGLHREGDAEVVFPLVDCRITSAPLMALWRALRRHGDKLPRDLRSLGLRLDREGGRHVVAATGGEPWDAGALAAALADPGVSYWWWPERGAARVVAGGRTGFPALAFEQVNPVVGARIREEAVAALGVVAGRVVWDLYGGVGDTARALGARGARVWSVDADQGAIDWARRTDGDSGITYMTARVEDVLRRLPSPDGVIVNPPRAGLAGRVATHLERWARLGEARRLSYVSCDPATLARDLKRMPSFRIVHVTAYDLFPQTAHVESLVVLEAA
ncbi:MAG: class I SAM-dependent RNA methyltransferase [Gemmatimonadetes bacterium]|nr:class I SAM-dependent RNA methyltransferase [Gemmatimonadota bacterium]